jgi:hypothetical protein
MSHHSESGQSHNKRKEHDRKARQYESETRTPWIKSKNGQRVFVAITILVVIGFTWFLAFGVFHL